jgi:DNA processing protein
MTLFGLDATRIPRLVSRLRSQDEPDTAGTAEVALARAALTMLAEPGDAVLGALVTRLGPVEVLDRLVRRITVREWARAVCADGPDRLVERGDISRGLERWLPRLDAGALERALEIAGHLGAALVIPGDRDWPAGVDDLQQHAPIALWVRGPSAAVGALARSIALVGARAATRYGEHVTVEMAAGLSDRGFAIVSGAAYGIDGAAHRAALASGGVTVAFLAGGVDRFYPAGHDSLLSRIAETGAVISEMPCTKAPTKWRFLQRNRLIAAASQATLVLEAGARSGSLNTAGHAAELGRPVGAVPGSVTSPASAGCHRLLREFAAVCVTDATQAAELHPSWAGPTSGATAARLFDGEGSARTGEYTSDQVRVIDGLSRRVARSVAELVKQTGVEPAGIRSALGQLELDGAVRERGGGWLLVGRR